VRVGVYIDGFNLYYGARKLCGAGSPGWRWLDVRTLIASRIPAAWTGAHVDRVVYCTARVSGVNDPSSPLDQDRYLRALQLSGSVDHIEYGNFVTRVRTSPLATAGRRGRPILTTSTWPGMIQDASGNDVPDGRFLVSHQHREEKGSDVNVATHLLQDVLTGAVDGAIVVSNDSDLKLPVAASRDRVPVGIVTPGGRLAGDLAFSPGDGVGGHWHALLDANAVIQAQLPDPVGPVTEPSGW